MAVGAEHFRDPESFVEIMPPYLPWHRELVYLSGALELGGGLGLLYGPTSRTAAWVLTATLIGIFPANVHMAVSGAKFRGSPRQRWKAWARLPLQALLIGWVLAATAPDGAPVRPVRRIKR
ncbi:MAG: DoxX family membrane protein [Armatimonadetes bacterium]|nr:DoxX family membrane protein [Armatimonadota bacterium]